MSDPDRTLAAIVDAVTDWQGSRDSMRWAPWPRPIAGEDGWIPAPPPVVPVMGRHNVWFAVTPASGEPLEWKPLGWMEDDGIVWGSEAAS